MRLKIAALALLALPAAALPRAAWAQTANVSPTSPSGAGSGDVARTAPSGSTAMPGAGQPQIGAPTPTEQRYEERARRDTASVCKGC